MKPKTPIVKRSSFWTLAMGVAIGGAIGASLTHMPGISNAIAAPPVNQRLAGAMSSESMATLRALDASYETLAGAVEPAVVNIHVKANAKPGMMSMGGAVEGAGSGVIIRPDNLGLVTNDHVVDGMEIGMVGTQPNLQLYVTFYPHLVSLLSLFDALESRRCGRLKLSQTVKQGLTHRGSSSGRLAV